MLQRELSMEGVILINSQICENQGSEKLSHLPEVRSCIVVGPGLPTTNLAFFLLLHDVSVNNLIVFIRIANA